METLARILESILRTAAGWPDWIGSAAALLGALFFSLLLHALLFRVLQRWVNTDSGIPMPPSASSCSKPSQPPSASAS